MSYFVTASAGTRKRGVSSKPENGRRRPGRLKKSQQRPTKNKLDQTGYSWEEMTQIPDTQDREAIYFGPFRRREGDWVLVTPTMNIIDPHQIKLTRKYLKLKIMEDTVSFRGHNLERSHVYEIIKKTISEGESHSALIIGPRGCGKTTLINSVLHQLSKELDLADDAIIVKLNGLIHHEEKVALKAITAQMQLENAVGDQVFGTFAENLSFLLSCLQCGGDRKCKSVIVILEECDLFCYGRTQTLLYNLFDVTHSGQAPLCVLGITSRLDFMDLLEKRVRSRFSHRHVFLFPNEVTDSNFDTSLRSPLDTLRSIFKELLTLPQFAKKNRKGRRKSTIDIEPEVDFTQFSRCKIDPKQFDELDQNFISSWNAHILSLSEDEKLIDNLEKMCYYTVNEQIFRDVMFRLVSKLSSRKPYIDINDVSQLIDTTVSSEQKIDLLQSISVLELSLVIAMKHGLQIFDGQPMNFEMVLHRYTKFASVNSSSQTVPRPVILKAFEHLQALEIVTPVKSSDGIYAGADTTSRVQKEYQLFTLATPACDVDEAVKRYRALPTEIAHWCHNSIV